MMLIASNMQRTFRVKALPYVLILSTFWGTNAVAGRFGIGQFDPYLFISLRLVIANLTFWPALYIIQGRLPTNRNVWRRAALSGLLGVAIPIPAFILSLQYQSSGVAGLYVISLPAMLAVAAHFFLPDEKLSPRKGVGVALAICGALLLALRGESGLAGVERANPLGAVLVMGGGVFEVINTIFVRLRMRDTDPLQVTAIRLATAAVVVCLVTVVFGDVSLARVTRSGYAVLAYTALIGTLAAQFLAFYVQRTFGVTMFLLSTCMVPIVATLTGALWLEEIVTGGMLVGMALIGSGLLLVHRTSVG